MKNEGVNCLYQLCTKRMNDSFFMDQGGLPKGIESYGIFGEGIYDEKGEPIKGKDGEDPHLYSDTVVNAFKKGKDVSNMISLSISQALKGKIGAIEGAH